MRRIDPQSGELSAEDTELYSLATRERPTNPPPNPPGLPGDWQAVEAPVIVHHGDYYYLFVSWDLCCRGLKSNYRTMVGRSRNITGPYVDGSGKSLLSKVAEHHCWWGTLAGREPRGESVLQQPDGHIIVFHAYDGKSGKPWLQISSLKWTDGWPHAALGDGSIATAK